MLNDPVFLEAARVFAQRIMLQGGYDPNKQIEYAFRVCLARSPSKLERERVLALYQQQLNSFEHNPGEAEKLLSQGSAEPAANLPKAKLASWAVVGNVILNLDETLSKE